MDASEEEPVSPPRQGRPPASYFHAIEGRTVIYQSGYIVHAVQFEALQFDEAGLLARVHWKPLQGLAPARRSPWELYAAWTALITRPSYLAGTYGKWRLFTAPEVVAAVSEIVSPLGSRSYLDDYHRKAVTHPTKFGVAAIETPGATASRLLEYLQEVEWSAIVGPSACEMIRAVRDTSVRPLDRTARPR